MNRLRFAFDGLAFAGEFVERYAVFLDGGNHGRFLLDISLKRLGGGVQRLAIERGHRCGGRDVALGIVAVGGFAELNGALVDFVVGSEFHGKLGGSAEEQNQEAGGGGVEGAAMADLLEAVLAADNVHNVVRGGAGRLVDEQCTVQFVFRLAGVVAGH